MSDRRNLVQYMHVYSSASGSQYVIVETGMPEESIRVGVGDTLREAYDSREITALQSTYSVRSALTWAHGAGWIDDPSSYDEDDNAELFEDEDEDEDEE